MSSVATRSGLAVQAEVSEGGGDAGLMARAPSDSLREGIYDPLEGHRGIQMRGLQRDAEDPAEVHKVAMSGVSGGGSKLPHLDRIQESFGGGHGLDGVQAHVGGGAAEAASAIGAKAYATGNDIAFQDSPDLFTAAHEAAHVVQQRHGVSLKGGVGEVGDAYEQHADAVASRVVSGGDASDLLAPYSTGETGSVQALDDEEVQAMDEDEDVQAMDEDEEVQDGDEDVQAMDEDEDVQAMDEDEEVQAMDEDEMNEDEEVQAMDEDEMNEDEDVQAMVEPGLAAPRARGSAA